MTSSTGAAWIELADFARGWLATRLRDGGSASILVADRLVGGERISVFAPPTVSARRLRDMTVGGLWSPGPAPDLISVLEGIFSDYGRRIAHASMVVEHGLARPRDPVAHRDIGRFFYRENVYFWVDAGSDTGVVRDTIQAGLNFASVVFILSSSPQLEMPAAAHIARTDLHRVVDAVVAVCLQAYDDETIVWAEIASGS